MSYSCMLCLTQYSGCKCEKRPCRNCTRTTKFRDDVDYDAKNGKCWECYDKGGR